MSRKFTIHLSTTKTFIEQAQLQSPQTAFALKTDCSENSGASHFHLGAHWETIYNIKQSSRNEVVPLKLGNGCADRSESGTVGKLLPSYGPLGGLRFDNIFLSAQN